MEFLFDYGLAGLFVAAFLAATILPFSSELLLIMLVHETGEWLLPLTAASVGNILGSLLNYFVGFYGESFVFYKIFRMKSQTVTTARLRFQKYGVYSLLFAWVPIVGDPLTIAAGAFRVQVWLFTLLVGVGKTARYAFLVFAMTAV